VRAQCGSLAGPSTTWSDSNGSWNLAGNWTSGTPNVSTNACILDGTSAVILDLNGSAHGLELDHGNGWDINDGEALSLISGTTLNYGTITGSLSNSGTLTFNVDAALITSGTLNNNAGAGLRNSGTVDIRDGLFINLGTFTNTTGDARLLNESFLNNDGTLTNFGTLLNNGDLANFGTLINSGTLTNNTELRNYGTLDVTNTYTQSFILTDVFGRLKANAYQHDGGVTSIELGRTISVLTFNMTGGRVQGNGTIVGAVVMNGGTLTPGIMNLANTGGVVPSEPLIPEKHIQTCRIPWPETAG